MWSLSRFRKLFYAPVGYSPIRGVLKEARKTRLSSTQRAGMVFELKRRLSEDPLFLDSLPHAVYPPFYGRVRTFTHKGKSVVVKRIVSKDNPIAHGYDVSSYNRFFEKYGKELKKGAFKERKYILVRLRPYATFKQGNNSFIVMEHLSHAEPPSSEEHIKHLDSAFSELERDVSYCARRARLVPPQSDSLHAIVLGNTNPSNPLKGKWVIALPHDRG